CRSRGTGAGGYPKWRYWGSGTTVGDAGEAREEGRQLAPLVRAGSLHSIQRGTSGRGVGTSREEGDQTKDCLIRAGYNSIQRAKDDLSPHQSVVDVVGSPSRASISSHRWSHRVPASMLLEQTSSLYYLILFERASHELNPDRQL